MTYDEFRERFAAEDGEILIGERAAEAMATIAAELHPERQCGECQLCCRLTKVDSIAKRAGELCHHACATGCAVYGANQPIECRVFLCGWRMGYGQMPERPDRVGFVGIPPMAAPETIPWIFQIDTDGRTDLDALVWSMRDCAVSAIGNGYPFRFRLEMTTPDRWGASVPADWRTVALEGTLRRFDEIGAVTNGPQPRLKLEIATFLYEAHATWLGLRRRAAGEAEAA